MRIPDDTLQNVVFIGYPTKIILDGMTPEEISDLMHWGGTGFFLTLPSECNRLMFTYLVTAKHLADKAKTQRLFLRLNGRDGGIVFFRMPEGDHWFQHPNTPDEVDVAVIPWWPPPEVVTFRTMDASDWCLSDGVIEKRQIGPGDEVFAVGLFTKMTGRERNFPIV